MRFFRTCTTRRLGQQFPPMTKFDLRGEDCVTGMSQLTNESVDLVVTSPPYNLGIDYRQYADRQDRQSYLDWCATWSTQIRRILRSKGSFFLNVGSAPSNPMLPHQIVIELTSASGGFVLQNTTSLDQVDRHRHRYGENQTKRPSPQSFPWPGRVGREAPVEDRSHGKNTRPLQADQLKTISQRLPRIHFPFHQDRSRRAGSAGGWRSVPGQKQHRAMASHARE